MRYAPTKSVLYIEGGIDNAEGIDNAGGMDGRAYSDMLERISDATFHKLKKDNSG